MTNEERLKKVSETKQKKFQESIKHVNIDDLRRMYLQENKSYEYIRAFYNLTGYTLDKILRENNIKKPRKQSAALVLETKYQNAGSKENYDKQTYQKTCENLLSKGVTKEEHYASIANKCKQTWNCKSKEEIDEFVSKLQQSYFSDYAKILHAKEARALTNVERYGVDNTYKLATYISNSKPNKEFASLLESFNTPFDSEVFLSSPDEDPGRGFRFDFKVHNTLLEINPWPFHNSTWSPVDDAPLSKDYHYRKTLTAKYHNYRCIHIWDWDNKEKILNSLLTPKKIVYARCCTVNHISPSECDEFLNTYHFQRTCKNQLYCYGLYYDNQLVQVMTFGLPRYNKKYEWELLRLCTCYDYRVVGGSARLWKTFIKEHNPTSILSYCDNAKFNGDVYKELGMTLLSEGSPTRHWYHPELDKHVTDNYLRQRGFDQLFGKIFGTYGKGSSNSELMLKHGFVEIYDCGQSTYVWGSN